MTNEESKVFLVEIFDQKSETRGGSINRIGYKTFSIALINDEEINNLLFDKISAIVGKLTK